MAKIRFIGATIREKQLIETNPINLGALQDTGVEAYPGGLHTKSRTFTVEVDINRWPSAKAYGKGSVNLENVEKSLHKGVPSRIITLEKGQSVKVSNEADNTEIFISN